MNKLFTWILTPIYESTTIFIEDGGACSDVFLYNNNTSVTAIINGSIILAPGSNLSLPAFGLEQQTGSITINFSGGNGNLIVGRKRYK